MPRSATNVVPAKTESIKKRIADGKGLTQKEWRIDGHPRLLTWVTNNINMSPQRWGTAK